MYSWWVRYQSITVGTDNQKINFGIGPNIGRHDPVWPPMTRYICQTSRISVGPAEGGNVEGSVPTPPLLIWLSLSFLMRTK